MWWSLQLVFTIDRDYSNVPTSDHLTQTFEIKYLKKAIFEKKSGMDSAVTRTITGTVLQASWPRFWFFIYRHLTGNLAKMRWNWKKGLESPSNRASKYSMDDPATIVMIVGIIVCFFCIIALILCCNWVRIEKWFARRREVRLRHKSHVENEVPQFQDPPPPYDASI